MSLGILVPYKLDLKAFRQPRNIYHLKFGKSAVQQASRHQGNKIADRDDFRDNKERRGRRYDGALPSKCPQRNVDRRREAAARWRDDQLLQTGEPLS